MSQELNLVLLGTPKRLWKELGQGERSVPIVSCGGGFKGDGVILTLSLGEKKTIEVGGT